MRITIFLFVLVFLVLCCLARDEHSRFPRGAPTKLISGLQEKLPEVNSPLATNVEDSLDDLTTNWAGLGDDEREAISGTLETITSNFDAFVNAKDNPVGAIQGAIGIVGSITSNFGPQGQLVGIGLGFVSSILGLFGQGANEQQSIGEIMSKIIKDALSHQNEQNLKDEARGVIRALDESKAYLDGAAATGKSIDLDQMNLAAARVPIVHGSIFMQKLLTIINRLFKKNSDKLQDASKAIKYTELYAQISALRDMLLTQFISLAAPDENLKSDVSGLINTRKHMRKDTKALFEKLYIINYSNKILPYFDPKDSPVTDMYAKSVFGLGNYSAWLAGSGYCISESSNKDIVWTSNYPYPYFVSSSYKNPLLLTTKSRSDSNCYWKLVPHGDNIYSIVNKYKCESNHEYCNYLLSIDLHRACIRNDNPVLFTVYGGLFDEVNIISLMFGDGIKETIKLTLGDCDESKYNCNQELRCKNGACGYQTYTGGKNLFMRKPDVHVINKVFKGWRRR